MMFTSTDLWAGSLFAHEQAITEPMITCQLNARNQFSWKPNQNMDIFPTEKASETNIVSLKKPC